MKYHEMTKNYIFREFECGLSIEQTAELCFKTVRTIKDWDDGKAIPKECKRLMRTHKRLDLSFKEEWMGFKMVGGKLELPNGKRASPQELLAGSALLEINSELEIKSNKELLRLARCIARIMSLK